MILEFGRIVSKFKTPVCAGEGHLNKVSAQSKCALRPEALETACQKASRLTPARGSSSMDSAMAQTPEPSSALKHIHSATTLQLQRLNSQRFLPNQIKRAGGTVSQKRQRSHSRHIMREPAAGALGNSKLESYTGSTLMSIVLHASLSYSLLQCYTVPLRTLTWNHSSSGLHGPVTSLISRSSSGQS